MSRELLARAWAAGAGPGDGPLTIDLDSTICETYGLAKEGARHHSYTGQRGYHPLQRFVGHKNATVGGAGDLTRPPELSIFGAAGSPFFDVFFIGGADAYGFVLQVPYGLRSAPVEGVHHAVVSGGQGNRVDEPAPAVGQGIQRCGCR